MQFIDKGINRVLKWESIDVSIPEMIDLVQTEIIEKASDKDLIALEKGMQKTFVLAVGGGSSLRYYPAFGSPARLCLDFNMFTHQLQKISLQDTVNKKEYYIPTGKASCTRLQSGVIRRIAQYKHGAAGTAQKPRNAGGHPPKTPEGQGTVLYCKYCGEMLEPGTAFCVRCGKPLKPQSNPAGGQNRPQTSREDNRSTAFRQEESLPYDNYRLTPRASGKGGKFAQKRQSPAVPIVWIVGVIALCAVLVVDAFALIGNFGEPSTKKNIKTVQNGYLGEFTNLTVKEILDNSCGAMYEDSVWDGGETDSGKKIVQVKFFNESFESDPMVIQFTMLDRDCFKITSYVDPISPIEKSTDLFAEMNWNYLMAFLGQDETIVGNKAKEYSFFQHLDQISGSAVQYGAAANYRGDRARLCELDNEKPLEVSVAMLIDNYGLMDMTDYLGPGAFERAFGTGTYESEDTSEDLPDSEWETFATEATLPETLPPQTEPPIQEGSLELLVTVRDSSGGVNIRSGPGASYDKLGRLAAGETVTVTKVQSSGSSQWGKIDRGWICMDYVEVAGQHVDDTTSVCMTVCVKPSAGELKIRSGPGSSYNEVGRLQSGEYATVTELQQNGYSQWGRIEIGWICMDYVDIITDAKIGDDDPFTGSWIEDAIANKLCSMTVWHIAGNQYQIEIQQSMSASETMFWDMPAEYDASLDYLEYDSCRCVISVIDGNGNSYNEVQYENGDGILYLSSGELHWQDYTGNIRTSFMPNEW